MKLTIRKKMLLCVFLPISILGIIIVLIAVTSLKTSIIHQVENSLRGTASATLAAYDQNSGSYTMADNGDIWKGGYNISRSEKLLDTIRERSGMEVTFFYGPKRVMTSIMDESGNRILGSPAGAKIQEEVLQKGQEYFSKEVSIDGEMYYGYYVPVFQSGESTNPIGMVFAGVNKNETITRVFSSVYYMLIVVVLIAIISMVVAGLAANSISTALHAEIACVEEVATGDLSVSLNQKHMQRKDDVKQAMDTITADAASQAEDTRNASENINHMGDLIIETGSEADALNKSADTMLESSDKTGIAILQLKEINEESVGEVMEEIHTSIINIRSIESKTQELEQSRTEMIGMISGLSDIAESNVTNMQETGEVITEMSEHFKEVQQSALNLKETADILEQNIRNFKL